MTIPDEVHRTTYSIIVGRILAKYRIGLGIKQSTLAHEIGMEQPAWSRIERGEIGLDMETLVLAAHVLEQSPQTIINEAQHATQELRDMGVDVLMTRPTKKTNVALALLTGAALAFLLTQIAKK